MSNVFDICTLVTQMYIYKIKEIMCCLCVRVSFTRFWRHYGSLSRHLMALKLQHYTKFLFVRDPFVRLISAFRNKFGRCVSVSGWVETERECVTV